jgi:hypothetical protein
MSRGIYVRVQIGDGTRPEDKVFEAKWPVEQKLMVPPTKAEPGHDLILTLLIQDQERTLAVNWGEEKTPYIEAHGPGAAYEGLPPADDASDADRA